MDESERAFEAAYYPTPRQMISEQTLFTDQLELDDGNGRRWLQQDGAGNAWEPDPDVLALLDLVTSDEYRLAMLRTKSDEHETLARAAEGVVRWYLDNVADPAIVAKWAADRLTEATGASE